MNVRNLALGISAGLAVAGCDHASPQPDRVASASAQAIDWREGDVDDAFAEAKESGKPILLYWGAVWCPPCAHLKSTLFKDPTFIRRTRGFVPVYLDGDSKGAQSWGERFGIEGYPTVIILRPDQSEVVRLSTSSTPAQLVQVLDVALRRTTSSTDLLTRALDDPTRLSPDDWSLLSNYEWFNDNKHLNDKAKMEATLSGLARAAPSAASQHRFGLLALAANLQNSADGKGALSAGQRRDGMSALRAVLASYPEVKASRSELSYMGAQLVAAVEPDPHSRAALDAALIAALDRIYADTSLPIADRFGSINAELEVAKDRAGTSGTIAPATLAKVQQRAAWADREANGRMERQSVIATAAELLAEAGDTGGSERLLAAEIRRSVSPYYYMSVLSGLAEERKDMPAAIEWARRAYAASQGPATRVQWAIDYSDAMLRLTPKDAKGIEQAADDVIDELTKSPGSYYQRTRRKVSAWGASLHKWGRRNPAGAAILQRLDARMKGVCTSQTDPAARDSCEGWDKTA